MNIDEVNALAGILTAHGLNVLEVSEGDTKYRLEKTVPLPPKEYAGVQADIRPVMVKPAVEQPETVSLNFSSLFEVKSPLVGVFHAAPSTDSEPFTHIGAKVKKGDVLCLIEAMKLMNEICAERDGDIADVCLKDGDIAEFGQVLFKIL